MWRSDGTCGILPGIRRGAIRLGVGVSRVPTHWSWSGGSRGPEGPGRARMSSRGWPCARSPVATGGRRPGRRSSSPCRNTPGHVGCRTSGADGPPTPPPPCPAYRLLRRWRSHQRQAWERPLRRGDPRGPLRPGPTLPKRRIARPPTTRGDASAWAGPDSNHLPLRAAQHSDGHPWDGGLLSDRAIEGILPEK